MNLLGKDRKPVCEDAHVSLSLDEPLIEPADPPTRQPPLTPPAPCDACGSAFFWESPDRQAHCCGCVPIPSRRMAVGGWVVAWLDGAAAWREHEFVYWRPFDHLESPAADLPYSDF